MRLLLAALLALTAAPVLAQPAQLTTRLVTDALDMPVFATAPADPRLFIVEQSGRIRIVDDGNLRAEPFLDLSASVSGGGEQGLLGLAFHPDYASNGRFFVNYTDTKGDTQIVAYTVSADPDLADHGLRRNIAQRRSALRQPQRRLARLRPRRLPLYRHGRRRRRRRPAEPGPEPGRTARQDPAPRCRWRRALRHPAGQSLRQRRRPPGDLRHRRTQPVAHRLRRRRLSTSPMSARTPGRRFR